MRLSRAVQIQDPRGLVVTVTPDDWDHVLDGHPEMAIRFEDVLQALRTPTVIQSSTTDPESQVYFWLKPIAFGRFAGLYVAVVVKIDQDSATGRVRTAYLTGRLGRGQLVWVHKP